MKKQKYLKKASSPEKKLAVKRTWLIVANLILFFVIYQGCIRIGDRIGSVLPYKRCTVVYGVCIAALAAAYFVMVRGKPGGVTPPDELPHDWSAVKRQEFHEKEKQSFEKAKWLLCWIFPFIAVLLIDILDLFVVEYLKQALSGLL